MAWGAGSVSGTITTDDALGVLSTGDILDWDLEISDGSTMFDIEGPASGNNSAVFIVGSDLSETATDLLFNFSGTDSGLALFQSPEIGSRMDFFCLETDTSCTVSSPAGESLDITGGNQSLPLSGVQSIVTLRSSSSTPELGTLRLLALGAALLLLRPLRRRRS